jgi:hypothetical protein
MADEERSTPHERPDEERHREPERHEAPREEHEGGKRKGATSPAEKGKVGQFISDHKLAVASVVIGLIGLWLFIRHQSSSAASQAAQAGAPGAATPSEVTGAGGGYLSPGTLEPGTLPPGATGGQPGGTVNIFVSSPPPTGGTPPPAPVPPTPPPAPVPPTPHLTVRPPKHEAKRKPSPKPTKTRTVVGHTHIIVPPPEGPAGRPSPAANLTTGLSGAGRTHIAVTPTPQKASAANLTTGLSGAGRTHIAVTPQKASQKPKPRYEVGRTMVRP